MKPASFEYVRAETAEHALEVLARHAGEASLLAGGQSLIPMMNLRLARPSILIDIGRLPLTEISTGPDAISIGALVRHRELLANAALAHSAPIVAEAVRHIAHPTIRNHGTAGGSVAYADPTAEIAALLLLLDGQVAAGSKKGTRTIAADDFFRGAFDTALGEDEMIVSLSFRPPRVKHGSAFLEISERQGDYAIAAVGALIVRSGDTVKEARIVLSGADSRPIRAREAERMLEGETITHATARDAAQAAVRSCQPYSDIRATAEYRKSLLETLVARALDEAWNHG
ncbi:MAG TPA: xanthine dehydrogenase family protein subunit M [Aestuariivirgaceae bacterium]|nr:xanthine dehydrogenase family protein subunit M [Aestuariivirgaceae bacterium]